MNVDKYDYIIIGAGPAGVSASIAFSKAGYKVALAEINNKLALKPCGNGLVRVNEIPFSIPKTSLKVKIRKGLLYVDGILAAEIKDLVEGYIIDKQEMLEELIANYSVNLFFKAKFNLKKRVLKVKESKVRTDPSRTILAMGNSVYNGEKIFAVETMLRPITSESEDTIEIYFDTKLVGYYWVFPASEGGFQVGVGGYASPQMLIGMLKKFIKKDERFREIDLSTIRGSYLAVGGLRLDKINGFLRVGESAGFVLPLTGEGIRPSMISGYFLSKHLMEGKDPLTQLRSLNISRAISVQRIILEKVKSMRSDRRRELLMSIPPEVHAEVALGTLRKPVILKSLVSKPGLLKSILRLIV